MISFGFPAGFWALLALPAVLAIHFLQRQSRRARISTLFLLEMLPPESAAGRRWQRLRTSVPLWLQLLAVLLITWLLVQPRWLRREVVQQVVLMLDGSVSMAAFRAETQRALAAAVQRLGRLASTTEWKLLESDVSRPALYSGTDSAALLRAEAGWQPLLPAHDTAPAFAAAQSLLRGGGTLVFVTDRPGPVPPGAQVLAVGHPLENCGFSGLTVEGRAWRALVRNYGQQPQRRGWWVEAGGQKSPAQELALEPGQTGTLTGTFPAGAERCELVLAPDGFPLDDRLPALVPQPKPLAVAFGSSQPPHTEFFQRLTASLPNLAAPGTPADLRVAIFDPFHPEFPPAPAILFVADPVPGNYRNGETIAENDPLTEGLNWAGLLLRETVPMPPGPGDRPLVWQGERPLVFLRPTAGGAPLLVVNFDLGASNAARLPALVLLLHRFAEQVRAGKVLPEAANFECHQALALAADPALPAPAIPGAEPGALRAPSTPGFFTVQQGTQALLQGAAHFADVREADFHDAATADTLAAAERHLIERQSHADFLAPLWLLALAGAMGTSWVWKKP